MTMKRRAFKPMQLVTGLLAAGAVLLLACNSEPSSSTIPRLSAPLAARATGDVVVAAASPDSASQDTTLDVTISGSGFASGSIAQWALAGVTNPAQVRTNSTRYVNARTLVANITISASATTGKWDVMVTSGSKGGIGTELFTVKVRGGVDVDSRALITWDSEVNVAPPTDPANVQPAGIVGDGRDVRGQSNATSEYQGAFCGVDEKIYWYNSAVSQSGDLTFDADANFNTGMKACGPKRTLNFYLSYQGGGARGSATPVGSFSNVRQVMQLGPGEVRSQWVRFNYTGLAGCARIDFDKVMWSGTANARVTRLPDVSGARQWRVESEYPHVAMCTVQQGQRTVAKGTRYLPFAFTATEIRSPYPTYP